jgi:selenocysteine lyase/cysteine desulfurase
MICEKEIKDLEVYFKPYRSNIVGIDQTFVSPYGLKKIIYADWIASGRLYKPIEDKISKDIGPFVANTHTETSVTGSAMTLAYINARSLIKKHVNANEEDVLINVGTGMTGAINKFQRILGLKLSENLKEHTVVPEATKPVVFISHMEHHSNQTSWLETISKVIVIPSNEKGLICLDSFQKLLEEYEHVPIKIASVTACSNVTGIITEYQEVAKLIHKYKGLCFVDYACSAPYVDIDMHPKDSEAYLDAIFFSPHKFLGGPGASGVLIFNKKLYKNMIPDNPGGGTVAYTNPWGDHDFVDDIETREDGGTPGFLQTIKTALAIQLKEKMGTPQIQEQEHILIQRLFDKLLTLPNLHILAEEHQDRLGVFSFYIDNAHYNLIVKLLNDRFGIQTRGGCSCAGTYGHYLLNVDVNTSRAIEQKILEGCLLERPGWVRLSVHPTMTLKEIDFICKAITEVAAKHKIWKADYLYDAVKNEFIHKEKVAAEIEIIEDWFTL